MAPMTARRHPLTVLLAWLVAFTLAFTPATAAATAKTASREKIVDLAPTPSAIASQLVDASREIAPEYDDCSSGHLVAGERLNPDSGLIYLRARHYDPRTGRFLGMDRHPGIRKEPVTAHKFLYANANPVDVRDPSGQFGLGEMSAAQSIQFSLAQIQANTGFAFLGVAKNSTEEQFYTELGFMILGSVAGPAAKVVGRAFARGKAWIIGLRGSTSANSAALSKNMALSLREVPPGFAAHHIVGSTAGSAGPARKILDQCKIDINHPINGVALPKWMHPGGHSEAYYKLVNDRIIGAYGTGGPQAQGAVIGALKQLADDLEGGIVKVSDWSIMTR